MNANLSVYGVWKVTTEADCEGRTVAQLGTYEGFVDDIAFSLADKCYYVLDFELIDLKKPLPSMKKPMVPVRIKNLWLESSQNPGQRQALYADMFRDRPVKVDLKSGAITVG